MRYTWLMIILAVLTFDSQAQRCISGVISDAGTGSPLPGASIQLSTGAGVSSAADGSFRLCGLSGDSVLAEVSYVGYLPVKLYLKTGTDNLRLSLVPEVAEIDEVVITATRTATQAANIPVRINVISSSVMNTLPVLSIDEALKLATGVNYSRSFGVLSTKATVSMRGMSGKEQGRVLILLDGIPANKSDGGGFDWNLLDPATVGRIEITKGPGSAIYGSNAMGGVINIISVKPPEKFVADASLEYGSFNTAGGRISAGKSVKTGKGSNSLFWNLNGFYRQSDGYITQSEEDIKANPYIIRSNLREAGAGLRAGYSIGEKHSLVASLNYYDDHRGTGEKVHQPDGNTTDHDSYSINLSYKGLIKTVSIASSVYFQNEDYKKVNEFLKDDYTWYDVLSTRRDYGWLTSATRTFGSHRITAGFDFRNGSVDAWDKYYTSTDIVYNAGKMNTRAFFVQDEAGLLKEKVRVLAGLRYDVATFFDGAFYIDAPTAETAFMDIYQDKTLDSHTRSALSPRVSVQYRWNPGNRVYLGYSRGFRPAVLDDMCRSGRIKGGFKIASPSLKPEKLNNIEAGADLKPFNRGPLSRLSLEISAYYSRGTDFQYYVTNGQTIDMGFGERPIFVRANISDAEIRGAECSLNYNLSNSVTLYAGYAYAKAVILSYSKLSVNDTIDLSGKWMTDVPEHIVNAGLSWLNQYVNAGITYRFNGSMYINDQNTVDELLGSAKYPSYSTVDLKFWRTFYGRYKASVGVQNLFDVKIYDSKYYVGPGRFITVAVSVRLGEK